MSELFGNHIVGFSTRRLIYLVMRSTQLELTRSRPKRLVSEKYPYFDFVLRFAIIHVHIYLYNFVQVGKDQENAHSEKDSHSKNRGGKN